MNDLLVVKSKIVDHIKNKHQMQMGGDLAEGLSNEVEQLIEKAVRRCKSNNKTVVKAKHL